MVVKIRRDKVIEWLVACFVVFLPLSWASFAFGSIYRMLIITSLVVFLFYSNGKFNIRVDNKRLFLMWSLYTVYSVISAFWSDDFSNSLTEALGMVLIYAVIFIFSRYSFEDAADGLMRAWILSGAICMMLFFFGEREIVGVRETLIILGTSTDHNEFASVFIVPVSVGIHLLLKKTSVHVKIFNVILVLLELYVIMLTGSRGALIATIFAAALTILFRRELSVKYLITVSLMLLILLYATADFILPLIPKALLQRFSLETMLETGGAGRAEIWALGWQKIFGGSVIRLLFGYGSGATIVVSGLGGTYAMHNQILQVLANYGIVGFIIYMCMLWESFQNLKNRNKQFLGAFWGMMLMSMTLSMSPSYKPLWILLLMGFCGCEKTEKSIRETRS